MLSSLPFITLPISYLRETFFISVETQLSSASCSAVPQDFLPNILSRQKSSPSHQNLHFYKIKVRNTYLAWLSACLHLHNGWGLEGGGMNYLGGNPFIIPSPTPNCSTTLGGPWATGHSAPGSPSREKTNHSHFPSLAQGLMKKTGPSSTVQHSCFWVFR